MAKAAQVKALIRSHSEGDDTLTESRLRGDMVTWNKKHPEAHLAGLRPERLAVQGSFGTHKGHASGRQFFDDDTKIPVAPRSLENTVFDVETAQEVAAHLARFGEDCENTGMIKRIEEIAAGRMDPTAYDARFLTHEHRELERYRARGWATGLPTSRDVKTRLWDTEHGCSLEEFWINEKRFPLYHPDVVEACNEW